MRGSAFSIPSILQTTPSSASRLSSSIPKSLALSIINSLDKFTSSINIFLSNRNSL